VTQEPAVVCRTNLLSDEPAQTDAFGPHTRVAKAIAELVSGGKLENPSHSPVPVVRTLGKLMEATSGSLYVQPPGPSEPALAKPSPLRVRPKIRRVKKVPPD
jgi:hypothetical protein